MSTTADGEVPGPGIPRVESFARTMACEMKIVAPLHRTDNVAPRGFVAYDGGVQHWRSRRVGEGGNERERSHQAGRSCTAGALSERLIGVWGHRPGSAGSNESASGGNSDGNLRDEVRLTGEQMGIRGLKQELIVSPPFLAPRVPSKGISPRFFTRLDRIRTTHINT